MDDQLAALDGLLAEIEEFKAEIEAELAKRNTDEKPPELQPPLPDSPTDPA